MLNKNSYLRINTYLLALILIATLLISFMSFRSGVSAAPAGCYAKISTAEFVSVEEYDCPAGQYTSEVAAGKCFVFTASNREVSSTGVETDCNTITTGSVPRSNSTDEPIETDCEPDPPGPLTRDNCGIINLIVIGINILSAIAGMAIIFSLMFAGFQYMTARDNSGQVQKAKVRIVWAIVALVLFIFMYALLNFLVPGGVL